MIRLIHNLLDVASLDPECQNVTDVPGFMAFTSKQLSLNLNS